MKKIVYTSIVVILAFTIYVSYRLMSISSGHPEKNLVNIIHESHCDLQSKECNLIYSNSAGVISIAPTPFHLNQKIEVKISFATQKKRSVHIDLKGLDMEMGYNKYELLSDDNQNYKIDFFLPTCTKNYMPWQLAVLIKDGDSKLEANIFKFLAEKK